MCGGFQCSKNTLLGLNIVYVVVAFLLIGVATYGKGSAVITSLPILGGIVASGVFLLFVAVLGLLATLKHHQILLFVYMIVLFTIFVIQFSCSCAAIGFDTDAEMKAIKKVWDASQNTTVIPNAEKLLNCCGWDNADPARKDSTCGGIFPEAPQPTVPACEGVITQGVDKAFNGSGGLGLFFAFTEILGTVLAYRYRNLANPHAQSGSATLFS